MKQNYESLLSYNIQRSYPFKWMTWAVLVGGIVATALFSVLNYVTNAFAIVTVYTTDPNGTLAETHWYDDGPFALASKFKTTCQPRDIPVNTQLFTTNLGLTYTLANVTRASSLGEVAIFPSLTYLNNTIQNCSVEKVLLEGINTNRLGNSPYWAWETSIVSDSYFPTYITLNVQWRPKNFIASVGGLKPSYFVRLDRQNGANLWWAQELLWASYYWLGGSLALINSNASVETAAKTISIAKIEMTPNIGRNISSKNFFKNDFSLIWGDGHLTYLSEDGLFSPCTFNLSDSLDSLSKVLYSTVLADLGSINAGPTPITDSALLQNTIENLGVTYYDDFYSGVGRDRIWETFGPSTGSLTVKPATFYTQYQCQVPTQKSAGSIIIAIFIADLVLLQALWTFFTLMVDFGLRRTDKTADHCVGCLDAHSSLQRHGDAQETDTSELVSKSVSGVSSLYRTTGSAYELLPTSPDAERYTLREAAQHRPHR